MSYCFLIPSYLEGSDLSRLRTAFLYPKATNHANYNWIMVVSKDTYTVLSKNTAGGLYQNKSTCNPRITFSSSDGFMEDNIRISRTFCGAK